MTNENEHVVKRLRGATLNDPHGLVGRSQATIRLAIMLEAAAVDLWEIATLEDASLMWDECRGIASRLLAACVRPG